MALASRSSFVASIALAALFVLSVLVAPVAGCGAEADPAPPARTEAPATATRTESATCSRAPILLEDAPAPVRSIFASSTRDGQPALVVADARTVRYVDTNGQRRARPLEGSVVGVFPSRMGPIVLSQDALGHDPHLHFSALDDPTLSLDIRLPFSSPRHMKVDRSDDRILVAVDQGRGAPVLVNLEVRDAEFVGTALPVPYPERDDDPATELMGVARRGSEIAVLYRVARIEDPEGGVYLAMMHAPDIPASPPRRVEALHDIGHTVALELTEDALHALVTPEMGRPMHLAIGMDGDATLVTTLAPGTSPGAPFAPKVRGRFEHDPQGLWFQPWTLAEDDLTARLLLATDGLRAPRSLRAEPDTDAGLLLAYARGAADAPTLVLERLTCPRGGAPR